MKDFSAVMSSKGQIVIPAELRARLGLAAGTKVIIRQQENGLVLEPINEDFIRRLCGSCKGANSLVEARDREHRMEDY
jgi:AbrB family looped-hinge helix DNA binding protein